MNWRTEKFRDIAKVVYGKSLPKGARNSSGKFPVYGSSGEVGLHSESLVNQPTLILARKGSIGNTFRVKTPSWPIDTVYYLNDIKLDLDYLYYFLRGQEFKNTATTIPSLRREDLEEIEVSFPTDVCDQKAIADVIETQFTRLDAAIKSLKVIKTKLEFYRQSVLKAAFEGSLLAGRGNWTECPLGDLIEFYQNGVSKRHGKEGKETNVLRLADIDRGLAILENDPRRIKLTADEIKKYKIDQNDLLIIRVNGSTNLVGRAIVFRSENEWAFCDHFIRVKLRESASARYISCFLSTREIRSFINLNKVSSAGQNTVSQTTLARINVRIPNLSEQLEIVDEIESRFSVIDKVEEVVNNALLKADRLRKSILKSAFEGKLVR